jgi:glycosyltransferase involved in cell wall biosynthesis
VIDGLAGIACEYDARSIAGAIRSTLSAPQLLRRLRAGFAAAAQKLDWPPVVAYLEAVYQRALI